MRHRTTSRHPLIPRRSTVLHCTLLAVLTAGPAAAMDTTGWEDAQGLLQLVPKADPNQSDLVRRLRLTLDGWIDAG